MQLLRPASPAEWEQVRGLFREYWASFNFSPCFQGFEAELSALPGAYAPPGGALVMALVEGEPAGCAALRPFEEGRCEAKRLYVRPQYRGMGLGRALLVWVIEEARTLGYSELVGDTVPQMQTALAMYDRSGFERTAPYSASPTPGAIYLRLKL